jgi:hypothetical protein
VEGYERQNEGRETHSCVLKFVLSLGKGEKIDNFDCQGSPYSSRVLAIRYEATADVR